VGKVLVATPNREFGTPRQTDPIPAGFTTRSSLYFEASFSGGSLDFSSSTAELVIEADSMKMKRIKFPVNPVSSEG
jgi:hypothetical protein